MPPPLSVALLLEKVLLFTVSVPLLKMPPPLLALLLEKVLLFTVSVPLLKMPPPLPLPVVLLPEKVLLETVITPLLRFTMPPPLLALLPEKVLLITVSVPKLVTPAPLAPVSFPLAMVRLRRVRLAPAFTHITRTALLPLMVTFCLLPSIVSVPCPLTMFGSVLVSLIVPLTPKVMVSFALLGEPGQSVSAPLFASWIASRRVQALSLAIVSASELTTYAAA